MVRVLKNAVQDAAQAIENLVVGDRTLGESAIGARVPHLEPRSAAVQHTSVLDAGPLFVRLAWHDAGTYDAVSGKYGPRASMRFECEASHDANKGLDRARDLLYDIHLALPMVSYADLWQLAGVVSIEMMGGPRIPFRKLREPLVNRTSTSSN